MKSNRSGRKSGRLKGSTAALLAALAVVSAVAVGVYIAQVHQVQVAETTTTRTTETESHVAHTTEPLFTTKTDTRTNTTMATETPTTTTATTTSPTETTPPVSLVWQKTYGGSEDDRAESIVDSGDGQFIVAGRTTSIGAGGWDAYLLKIDRDGNKIWEKTYGGSGDDIANSIVKSGDGGFIAAGWTTSFGAGYRDVYLLKIDGDGNKVWEKAYGGYNGDGAFSIVETQDGKFIAAGITTSFGASNVSAYLLKIDGNGNRIWEKTYGGSKDAVANWIIQSGDGEFVVAGWITSPSAKGSDVYLLKIDGDGDEIWEKTYGGSEDDWAGCIVQSGDGRFTVAGVTESFGAGAEDVYLLKIDSDGNKIWEKTYGGGEDDQTNRIIHTKDGGFIITGVTYSPDVEHMDAYFLKINNDGNKIWEKTYGGGNDDEPWEIIESENGEFIVVGWTTSFGAGKMDAYLLKIKDNT